MAIYLTNTLTRKKEEFVPLDPENVRMYVCGLTVYDFAHIGNARTYSSADLLVRLLKSIYPHVTYMRNITDIEDKIMARALQNNEKPEQLASRMAKQFHADMDAIGLLKPDIEPYATRYVAPMIEMIKALISKGNAYEAEGHVLFHVPSMPSYGNLSKRSQEELIAGARVEVAPYKKHPADFVLWKPSTPEQPGWESPWGRGRPGWHIECSAMTKAHFGDTFDIHAGGMDLIFPHHENELAQSCCANGTKFMAKVWIHCGMLSFGGEKMSKSLGNFFTVNELLQEFHGETIRQALLNAHYRQPLDFTKDSLFQARMTLDRWYNVLKAAGNGITKTEVPPEVIAALQDDLNTPLAFAHMHELASQFNRSTDNGEKARLASQLKAAGNLMGLLQVDPEKWFKWQPAKSVSAITDIEVEDLIKQREHARRARDFAKADEIRKKLAESGVILEDAAGGTTWKRG